MSFLHVFMTLTPVNAKRRLELLGFYVTLMTDIVRLAFLLYNLSGDTSFFTMYKITFL